MNAILISEYIKLVHMHVCKTGSPSNHFTQNKQKDKAEHYKCTRTTATQIWSWNILRSNFLYSIIWVNIPPVQCYRHVTQYSDRILSVTGNHIASYWHFLTHLSTPNHTFSDTLKRIHTISLYIFSHTNCTSTQLAASIH